MKSVRLGLLSGLIISLFFLASCASEIYSVAFPTLNDGKYDSEFPYKGCSQQLEEIGRTIRMLNCIVTYKCYILPLGSALRKSDITQDILEKRSVRVQYINNTASGTATVIYNTGFKVALITCAHIVSYPDTTFSFFIDRAGTPTEYVQAVSILQSQMNYITDFPDGGDVEVLAADRTNDIAILGKSFLQHPEASIPVFEYPVGRAKELEWGSFVYMFGFPLANKMVTKAIVSSPNRDQRGSFILDAVFNRGFSGGIILAVRDGVPNFELVGMVSSVPADNDYILTPPRNDPNVEFDTTVPYEGEIYVDKKVSIKYGVTRATSAETLKDFVMQNKELLESKGYFVSTFFTRERNTRTTPTSGAPGQ